jgi:hypothetical protein
VIIATEVAFGATVGSHSQEKFEWREKSPLQECREAAKILGEIDYHAQRKKSRVTGA